MAQAGRPLSELRGRTEEANELARWLRRITALTTVRELAADFHCSRTLWGEYRNGSKIIPEVLLVKVVTDLIPDLDMRARQLSEGLRLLKAAQGAEHRRIGQQKTGAPAGLQKTPVLPVGVAEVLLRLDDARLQQLEALRKLNDAQQNCARLETMVSFLEAERARLTEERDHARMEARDARKLQAALDQTETSRAQAEAHLRHARKANERAFELRLTAEANVAHALAEAHRTSGATTGPGNLLPQPAGSGPELLSLEHIGEALQAMRDQLAEQDEELDELGSHLGHTDPGADTQDTAAPNVITGQVIGRQNARPGDDEIVRSGNVNNPVTSTDNASSAELTAVVPALSAASSPADLGRVIEVLRERSGLKGWPLARMASKANTALRKDENSYTELSIGGWLDGTRFPRQLWSLTALVEAMDATPEERAAFSSAYLRIAAQESQAFKEVNPKITRQSDESFKGASLRVAQEEEHAARQQAVRALAAREKAERDKQSEQERKTRREAEVARLQEVRESARGHQAERLITEANRVSDVKDLARLLKRLQIRASVSTEDLARSVFASTQDRYITTVGKWLSGTALPTDHHFTLLMRALLVKADEKAALLRALHHARSPHTPSAPAPVPPAQAPVLIPTPSVQEAAEHETEAAQETEASRTATVVRRRDARGVRKRNAARFIRKADRVIGPKGLSRLLETLKTDAKLSRKDLSVLVLGSAEDEHITTVSKWMDGKVLPTKPLFTLLVRALLAWPDEETALSRAYDRARAAEEAGVALRPEPGLGSIWVVTRLGTCLTLATLWAVFTACLKADPGPHGLLLLGYTAGAMFLFLLGWQEMLSSSQHTERSAIEWFSWLGSPLAVICGLVLPRFPSFELWGRWPAELVGLL